MTNRQAEGILIDRNNTIKWINREINICIEQLKTMKRYQKSRTEGYLSALKKVQARLDGLVKSNKSEE